MTILFAGKEKLATMPAAGAAPAAAAGGAPAAAAGDKKGMYSLWYTPLYLLDVAITSVNFVLQRRRRRLRRRRSLKRKTTTWASGFLIDCKYGYFIVVLQLVSSVSPL